MWSLPGQDGGRGGLTGVFSPAVRFWPRGNWSYTIYRMRCTRWLVVGTKKGGGAWSTARNGGGRGGAPMFPPRGRRTWKNEARMSIMGSWGCYSGTWFGWRWGGRGSSAWRWLGFLRRRRRHGFLRFRPRRRASLATVGRRASRGGEEALECWN
jgi:hypothetical protein